MVYVTSELQRDTIKGRIYSDLKKDELLKKEFLPRPRRCKAFLKHVGSQRNFSRGSLI